MANNKYELTTGNEELTPTVIGAFVDLNQFEAIANECLKRVENGAMSVEQARLVVKEKTGLDVHFNKHEVSIGIYHEKTTIEEIVFKKSQEY